MARKSTQTQTGTKQCTKCGQVKETSTERGEGDFYKDRSQRDGFATWCKDCERAYNKAYHAGLKGADASKKLNIESDAGLAIFESALADERVTRGWYKKEAEPKKAAAKKATVTRAKARTAKAAITGKAPTRRTRSKQSIASEAGLTKAEQIDMGMIRA